MARLIPHGELHIYRGGHVELVIEAPTLTVDQPAEGASFQNGAIPVAGRATGPSAPV